MTAGYRGILAVVSCSAALGAITGLWLSDQGADGEVATFSESNTIVVTASKPEIALSLSTGGEGNLSASAALDWLDTLSASDRPLANQIPVYDMIRNVDTSELVELLDRFIQRGDDRFTKEVAGVMAYRAATASTEQLESWLKSGVSGDFGPMILATAVSTLAWKSIDDAIRFARSLPDSVAGMDTAYQILERRARESGAVETADTLLAEMERRFPDRASQSKNVFSVDEMREAISLRSWETGHQDFTKNFATFARKNPLEAVDMAFGLEAGLGVRMQCLQQALRFLAASEPLKVLGYSEKFDTYEIRQLNSSLSHAFSRALREHPEDALQWLSGISERSKSDILENVPANSEMAKLLLPEIQTLEPGRKKDQAIRRMMSSWGREDYDEALHWAEENLSSVDVAEVKLTQLNALVREDPESALQLVGEMETQDQRTRAASGLASAWPVEKYPELVTLLEERGDKSLRHQALMTLSQSWVRSDLPAAKEFADTLPSGQLKLNFQIAVGNALAGEASPREALEYAMVISDASTANHIVNTVLQSVAEVDPRQALSMLASEPRVQGNQRIQLMNRVGQIWAHHDPEAAANHFSRLNDPDALQSIKNVASNWSQIAPEKALNWSMTLPNAEQRDEVIHSLLMRQKVVESASFEAEKALAAISDPAIRERTLRSIERSLNRSK